MLASMVHAPWQHAVATAARINSFSRGREYFQVGFTSNDSERLNVLPILNEGCRLVRRVQKLDTGFCEKQVNSEKRPNLCQKFPPQNFPYFACVILNYK